jgi:hypothetical protein
MQADSPIRFSSSFYLQKGSDEGTFSGCRRTVAESLLESSLDGVLFFQMGASFSMLKTSAIAPFSCAESRFFLHYIHFSPEPKAQETPFQLVYSCFSC